jgi:glycosyltransferase involved in cell wall biosynthesis
MTASTGSRVQNPRRVLINVENLPVPFDRRVWQEATTLTQAGYSVAVICPKTSDYPLAYEFLQGVHIYRHSMPIEARGAAAYVLEYAAALMWQFFLACRVFHRHGFDVIHACNPPDTIFLVGGFFKLFFGKRFLFDHHDLNPELYLAKFGRRNLFYKILLQLERWTFRTADVSIATNWSYHRIAVERGGMDPEKVFVVRSGPSLERLRPCEPVPALKHGRQFLVGYVGVMGQQEGIQYLLEAVRQIVHDRGRRDIHFTLVGSGPELSRLKAMAVTLAIDGFVTFTGRLPDQDLVAVLSTADLCVNPDEVNEMNDKSTMYKVMEYMAFGRPIVQFETTEGRYSAREAAVYARPNDAADLARLILDLIAAPVRREVMGRLGYERVRGELAWPHQVAPLLRAYDAVWKAAPEPLRDSVVPPG